MTKSLSVWPPNVAVWMKTLLPGTNSLFRHFGLNVSCRKTVNNRLKVAFHRTMFCLWQKARLFRRCADFILQDYPKVLKVFCYSDIENAVSRCVSEYGIKRENAESEIRRINRNRIHHYEYYTGRKWGEPHHYNLMLNTGTISLETACQLIKEIYNKL